MAQSLRTFQNFTCLLTNEVLALVQTLYYSYLLSFLKLTHKIVVKLAFGQDLLFISSRRATKIKSATAQQQPTRKFTYKYDFGRGFLPRLHVTK